MLRSRRLPSWGSRRPGMSTRFYIASKKCMPSCCHYLEKNGKFKDRTNHLLPNSLYIPNHTSAVVSGSYDITNKERRSTRKSKSLFRRKSCSENTTKQPTTFINQSMITILKLFFTRTISSPGYPLACRTVDDLLALEIINLSLLDKMYDHFITPNLIRRHLKHIAWSMYHPLPCFFAH